MKFMYLTIELIVGFFFLFIIVKFVGKKIINQISPFTFIAAIVLGELLGNALYDHKIGVFYIVYSMTIWGGLLFLVEYLSQKFLTFRGVVEGKPSARSYSIKGQYSCVLNCKFNCLRRKEEA